MIFVLYAGVFYNEPEPLQTELELWTDHSFVPSKLPRSIATELLALIV